MTPRRRLGTDTQDAIERSFGPDPEFDDWDYWGSKHPVGRNDSPGLGCIPPGGEKRLTPGSAPTLGGEETNVTRVTHSNP